jgi:hypothetical protein
VYLSTFPLFLSVSNYSVRFRCLWQLTVGQFNSFSSTQLLNTHSK